MSNDQIYMERALELAAQGKGRTSPNPMVGAVVVRGGSVIGEGYHRRAGEEHAEVIALREAGEFARGATLYISLEPCCHYGKTPPCTDRIIEMGINRVVAAMLDPNPLVCGKGFEQLRGAGIEGEWGLMEAEACRLNEAYLKFITKGVPFVILKGAMSLDGKIATASRQSKWITGPEARERVHRLRDQVDAVMVGMGTVLQDDPQLTTRLPSVQGRDPLRIVLDPSGEIPLSARVIASSSPDKTLLITSSDCPEEKSDALRHRGVEVWVMPERNGKILLRPLLTRLGEIKVMSLMIEGGAEVNASALEEGIVDKVILFLAPRLIGGRHSIPLIGGEGIDRLEKAILLKNISLERVGDDIMIQGYLNTSPEDRCSPA